MQLRESNTTKYGKQNEKKTKITEKKGNVLDHHLSLKVMFLIKRSLEGEGEGDILFFLYFAVKKIK